MKISNRIFKNAIIYSVGNYSSKFIAILIFPIIVTYLGLDDTGRLDLIVSTVTIAATIFSLQIGEAIYRWFHTNDLKEQQISFSNGLAIVISMIVLISIIYLLGYFFIDFPKSLWTLSYLVLISHIILNIVLQLIRGIGNVTRFTIVGITKSLVYTGGSLLAVVYTTEKLYNVLLALLLSNIIGIVFTIWRFDFTTFYKRAEIQISNILKLVNYSVPLILNALSWLSFFAINKYIIALNLELSDNGVFAVAEKLSIGIFFIGMFYYYSLQDHCLSSTNFKEERTFFKKIILRTVLLIALSIVFIILFLWLALPIYFPNLVVSLHYLPFLALANLFIVLSSYFGIVYNYQKKTLAMAITSFIGVALSLILSLLLVPSFGLYAVCFSILIGSILVFGIRLRYTINFFKIK